jgi:hypothetical protein
LEDLKLGSNRLAGQLPAELASLKKLEELELQKNNFQVRVGTRVRCEIGRLTAGVSKACRTAAC